MTDFSLVALPTTVPSPNAIGQTLPSSSHHVVGTNVDGAAVVFVDADAKRVRLEMLDSVGQRVRVVDIADAADNASPAVTGIDDSSFVVAYAAPDGDSLGVFLVKVGPTGAVSAPVRANGEIAAAQLDPDVVWTGSRVVVAWTDTADPLTSPDIVRRDFSTALIAQGPATVVASTIDPESHAALSRSPGDAVLAYRHVIDTGEEQIDIVFPTGVRTVGPMRPAGEDDRPALSLAWGGKVALAYAHPVLLAGGWGAESRVAIVDATSTSEVVTGAASIAAAPDVPILHSFSSVAFDGTRLFVSSLVSGSGLDESSELVVLGQDLVVDVTQSGSLPHGPGHLTGHRRPALATAPNMLIGTWEDHVRGLGATAPKHTVGTVFWPIPLKRPASGLPGGGG